jgi:peptidoglycan/LPS O-acetylase OafA/YrhL
MQAEAVIAQAGEPRSARVESLRALAALAVLVGHAYVVSTTFHPGQAAALGRVGDRLARSGGFGVFLFFVLSGYLLYLPFARRDTGGGAAVDTTAYLRNRALRILPLYYVTITVLLLAFGRGMGWTHALRFLLFIETFFDDTVGRLDGPAWSLVVELHFYVLLPLLALAAGRLARGRAWVVALFLGGIGLASLALRMVNVDLPRGAADVWRYSTLTNFVFFIPGMMLALARVAWERAGPPAWLPPGLRTPAPWLAAAALLWLAAGLHLLLDLALLSAAMLTVGACVLPLGPSILTRALEWRPLAALGLASYSLYLWHLPLLVILANLPGVPNRALPLLVLGLGVSVAAAVAGYRLVERPWLRLRRRWARPPGATAAGALRA